MLLALAQEVEDRAENPSAMLGLPTGFSSIDRITNGLQAPDMIVIGARPSVGKSALVTRIATNVALTGAPVLLMTLEMSAKQTATRMICAEARLSSHAFKAGRLSRDEWNRYNEASKMFYELPIDINDQGAVTPNYLRGEIRRSIKKHGRSPLVIVDYLQLMKADDATNGRYETVTALSIDLKPFALSLSCRCLFCLSLAAPWSPVMTGARFSVTCGNRGRLNRMQTLWLFFTARI